ICGYLHSDDPLFDPTFAAFPPVFVVRPPSGPAAEFVQASIQWALATSSGYEPDWSVAELASRVAVSRSLLDQRFRKLLGRPPIRYLAEWRMHLATDLLATTELPVVQIARRVGYESEEAFSRAFKRSTDIPPSVWRLEHATPRSPQSVDTS